MDFAIGGVAVAALIVGLVEFAKEFGVQGKWSKALAFGLGVLFTSLAYGIEAALIPAEAVPYIVWAVTALAGGPAAMGYYDLGKRFLVSKE